MDTQSEGPDLKAKEIKAELVPLVKSALPTREEVRARCPLDCPSCTEQADRVSVYGFDKILRQVVSEYQNERQTDPGELSDAIREIRERWYEISQWED